MDQAQIEAKATELVAKYNSEGLSPFPYERLLADFPNLKIFFQEMEEPISGAILFTPEPEKTYNILINTIKSTARQHFTLGHELGHYFLHAELVKGEQGLVDDDSLDVNSALFRLDDPISTQVEIDANRFAAALLMPAHLVEKAWKELHSVQECAKTFRVSLTAMSIRLERLKLVSV